MTSERETGETETGRQKGGGRARLSFLVIRNSAHSPPPTPALALRTASPLKPALKRQKEEGEGWIACLSISGFIICCGQSSKEAFPVYRADAWGVELPPPLGRPQGLPTQETLADKVTWRQMPSSLGAQLQGG